MIAVDPAPRIDKMSPPDGQRTSDLGVRVASALVMAPLAIITAYLGGWVFALFWGAAAIGIFIEWAGLVVGRLHRAIVFAGGIALALATVLAGDGRFGTALLVIACGITATAVLAAPGQRIWTGGGVIYAGALLMAPIALRSDAQYGWPVMLLLFAVVWATDIGGYFAGRAIGGPKLWQRVSPKKTWAGAIAGLIAAIIAALLVAAFTVTPAPIAIAFVALLLSIASQLGDLFESAIKRRFHAKDASHLIPGHGGLMDRLDGFAAAALVAALFGLWRGGLLAPTRGLMLW